MGKTEKRELVGGLTVLLLHLLKWQYQPLLRGPSWQTTVINQRLDIDDHLTDNPSLKGLLIEATARAYRKAIRDAGAETGLPVTTFPVACPWTFAQLMAEDFWPGDERH